MSADFEYYLVEDEIVARLQPDFSSLNIVIEPLPETEEEFKRATKDPIVFVAFISATLLEGKPNSTNQHVYNEEHSVVAIVKSRLLRGDTGVHHIAKLVKEKIAGFQSTHLGRLYVKDYSASNPVYDSSNSEWSWEITFAGTKLFVQTFDDETDDSAPTLNQLNFNDTIQNP